MVRPATDDLTIISVKGVRKSAWEAARRGAAQSGDSMGVWLSDTIDRRISQGDSQITGPANPGSESVNPVLTPDQLTARILALAALQQSVASMKQARVRAIGRRVLQTAQLDLEHSLMAAGGLVPVRLIQAKDSAKIGQDWLDNG